MIGECYAVKTAYRYSVISVQSLLLALARARVMALAIPRSRPRATLLALLSADVVASLMWLVGACRWRRACLPKDQMVRVSNVHRMVAPS